MGSTDFKDLQQTLDKMLNTAPLTGTNAAHLARLLKNEPIPAAV